MDINQEMIDQSALEESAILARSPEVLLAQNQYLNNRVVVLRALVNEQKKEIDRLTKKTARKTAQRSQRSKPEPTKE